MSFGSVTLRPYSCAGDLGHGGRRAHRIASFGLPATRHLPPPMPLPPLVRGIKGVGIGCAPDSIAHSPPPLPGQQPTWRRRIHPRAGRRPGRRRGVAVLSRLAAGSDRRCATPRNMPRTRLQRRPRTPAWRHSRRAMRGRPRKSRPTRSLPLLWFAGSCRRSAPYSCEHKFSTPFLRHQRLSKPVGGSKTCARGYSLRRQCLAVPHGAPVDLKARRLGGRLFPSSEEPARRPARGYGAASAAAAAAAVGPATVRTTRRPLSPLFFLPIATCRAVIVPWEDTALSRTMPKAKAAGRALPEAPRPRQGGL